MNTIVMDKAVRSGEPCLVGTRLTVNDVINIVANGEQDDYQLTDKQIQVCRDYATIKHA